MLQNAILKKNKKENRRIDNQQVTKKSGQKTFLKSEKFE